VAEFRGTPIRFSAMSGLDTFKLLSTQTLLACVFSLALVADGDASKKSVANAIEGLLDEGSTTYCKDYTDEFVQYMLTRGTPDDVTMMENAVGYLDDGQWIIDSETLGSSPGADDNEVIVDVRCTWTTPIDQLNAPVDLKYRMRIDPDTASIVSVEDAN